MPNDVERTQARHEDVERRAYELYEQRGRADGYDWGRLVAGRTRTSRSRSSEHLDSHRSTKITSPPRRPRN